MKKFNINECKITRTYANAEFYSILYTFLNIIIDETWRATKTNRSLEICDFFVRPQIFQPLKMKFSSLTDFVKNKEHMLQALANVHMCNTDGSYYKGSLASITGNKNRLFLRDKARLNRITKLFFEMASVLPENTDYIVFTDEENE